MWQSKLSEQILQTQQRGVLNVQQCCSRACSPCRYFDPCALQYEKFGEKAMAVTPGPRTRSASWQKSEIYPDAGYYPSGALYKDYTGPAEYERYSERMDDVVTENYRERVAQGELFNNPMTKVVTREWFQHPSYERNYPNGAKDKGIWRTLLPTVPYIDGPSDISSMIEIAVTKAYAKVDSSIASLPVTLGELRETKEMLIKALVSLRSLHKVLKYYRDTLKFALGNRERTAFVAKEVLNGWMSVRFGWLPFAGDVKNLHKAMTAVREFEDRQTFRAGDSVSFTYADTFREERTNSHVDYQRTCYETVNVSAGVLCLQRYGGVPDTYGLTKIPTVLWELTRLSWAVDYFFNVGDVIASFTPDSLWTPAINWVTVRRRKTQVVTVAGSQFRAPTFSGGNVGWGYKNLITETVVRTPSPGRAGINFRPKLDWARYIDLVGVAKSPVKNTIREISRLYRRYQRR